jgi:superfamily II DNA or RNA helicase
MVLCLSFDRGSLLVRGSAPGDLASVPELEARDDERVGAVRVPAHRYHLVVRALTARRVPYEDKARSYATLDLGAPSVVARDYQTEAVAAWRAAGRRGVVVLPTGSGKTLVAAMAIADTGRSTLVVVPTLDLLHQWYDLLAGHFGAARVGAVGGGEHRPAELTVTTYDSAYLHLDRLGDRFGLVVWDEAHHLGSPSATQAARMALAPFSLGLTATPIEDERAAGVLEVAGPIVFRRSIVDLAGDYLSPYDTVRVKVALSDEERAAYDAASRRYREFIASRGIRLGGPDGWRRFLEQTSRSPEGRAAFAAWREQRRLALASGKKLEVLDGILRRHASDRSLVFTNDNAAAYEVCRRFLVPAITHQTRPAERRAILQGLRDGALPVVVTSRVLNEGVDVPSVSVGIVLSGTATVREHVQRLGRILRKVEGKRATLYEVVTEGTSEEAVSQRRRDHDAYR